MPEERTQGPGTSAPGSTPAIHVCAYCGKRVPAAGLPDSWAILGGRLACRQCQVVARVLVQ